MTLDRQFPQKLATWLVDSPYCRCIILFLISYLLTFPWNSLLLQTNLISLDMKGSRLHGTIPVVLAKISTLKHLNLADNEFVGGTFVEEIGGLISIEQMFLHQNGFDSTLPNEISKLTYLQNLNLHSNSFFGSIPPSFGDLTLLTELHLQKNQFSGPLPSMGKLTALTRLNLSKNRFSASIPTDVSKLSQLKTIFLHENVFTGVIPELGKLTNLGTSFVSDAIRVRDMISLSHDNAEEINMNQNELSGSIPSGIEKLTRLRGLHLWSNFLNSSIPDVSRLTNLGKQMSRALYIRILITVVSALSISHTAFSLDTM